MKWKLSDWASIAEIIAAIGVIFSLIFVGIQVSEGNLETRAATLQAATDAEASMVTTFIEHKETWDKVVTGQPLDDGAELRGGILLFNLLMIDTESRYHQFQSGLLDERLWQGHRNNLRPVVKLPLFKIWRESLGATGHSAEFLALLDSFAND